MKNNEMKKPLAQTVNMKPIDMRGRALNPNKINRANNTLDINEIDLCLAAIETAQWKGVATLAVVLGLTEKLQGQRAFLEAASLAVLGGDVK